MKKNRMVGIIGILLIIAMVFSGCGGGSTTTEETEESSKKESTTSKSESTAKAEETSKTEESKDVSADGFSGMGNSSGNINSGGHVAFQDGWIYLSDPVEKILYKTKEDGSYKTDLADCESRSINVAGEWIFFSNWSEMRNLFKIKTDGSEITEIKQIKDDGTTSKIYCDYLIAADGWLYLIDLSDVKDKIWRIRPDGTEMTALIEDSADSFCLDNGVICYKSADDDNIYTMGIDGSNREKLLDQNENIDDGDYLLADGWLYFLSGSLSKGYTFSKIKIDGSGRTVIKNMNEANYVHSFNVEDDWIYYYPDGLCKIKTDGSEQTFLVEPESDINGIMTAGDWIFYAAGTSLYRVYKDGEGNMLIH